ncbi:helix-turn-helix domain-containing protein [Kitasatospora camelliae]|uniref:Pyridoxamine 5'-phosphate oxidase family protein n=1 Tax=Kitasatospora camelliae TaxID=3156397 RepID=A0AAU8JQ64_9ACTN
MRENQETPGGGAELPAELSRRIVTRCEQRGLTVEEAAAQAGMSPRYLEHLLAVGRGFDPAALVRVAAVLGMTYQELVEGREDAPPGRAAAGAHPYLLRLTEQECWDRLGTHGVGRVAISADPTPLVLPVNYTVDGTAVAYRTSEDGPAAVATGTEVAFEVDHLDEHRGEGWSVLISGRAEQVEDPADRQRLDEAAVGAPWAGGRRETWIRITPATATGRRIRAQ